MYLDDQGSRGRNMRKMKEKGYMIEYQVLTFCDYSVKSYFVAMMMMR